MKIQFVNIYQEFSYRCNAQLVDSWNSEIFVKNTPTKTLKMQRNVITSLMEFFCEITSFVH